MGTRVSLPWNCMKPITVSEWYTSIWHKFTNLSSRIPIGTLSCTIEVTCAYSTLVPSATP
eukprot:1371558-Rhodomonas_salina.4